MKNNLGINIINLGKPNVFVKYNYNYFKYNINELIVNRNKLENFYNEIMLKINDNKTDSVFHKEIETQINILTFNRNKINYKINNFQHKRNKRGLINGLGSVLKSITGNPDAYDAERYEKLFKEIKRNQKILEKQNLNNIKYNKEMINKFNEQIQNLQHNELVLKSRVLQINQIINKAITNENYFKFKDLMNQILFLQINLITFLDELETGLTFCNINKLHSSIIDVETLRSLVKEVNSNLNFWEISVLVTTHCKYENYEIEYLLEIPEFKETNYELKQITPIPFDNFKVLNIEKQLIIEETPQIYYNTQYCHKINKNYYCKTNYITIDLCLLNVLSNLKINECMLIDYNKHFDIIEIENTNIYYIISKYVKEFKIECEKQLMLRKLQGIYKVNLNNNCKINGYNLQKKVNVKTEIIIKDINFNLENNLEKSNFSDIELKNINLINIKRKDIELIKNDFNESSNINIERIISITLLILIIIIIIVFKFRNKIKTCIFKKKNNENNENPLSFPL